ncbi:hypothetical protein [Rhodanobacter lindaniclasticus]
MRAPQERAAVQVDQHAVPLLVGDALRGLDHVDGHAAEGRAVDAHGVELLHARGAVAVDLVVVGAAGGDRGDARRGAALFEHGLELPLRFGRSPGRVRHPHGGYVHGTAAVDVGARCLCQRGAGQGEAEQGGRQEEPQVGCWHGVLLGGVDGLQGTGGRQGPSSRLSPG